MEVGELKEFLIIDGEEDDILLQGLMLSAEEFLLNAGVIKDYSKELYKLAIKMLVANWYQNREESGKNDLSSFSLQSIIAQLR